MMAGKRNKQRDVEMGSDLQRLQKMARDLYKGHEIEREVLLDLLEFLIEKVAEQPSLQGGYADLPPKPDQFTDEDVCKPEDRVSADLRPPQGETASEPQRAMDHLRNVAFGQALIAAEARGREKGLEEAEKL